MFILFTCRSQFGLYLLSFLFTGSTFDFPKFLLSFCGEYFFLGGGCGPTWAMASSFTNFLDQTQWRTTDGRTPLDEWSAHRRYLYLTIHNTQNKHLCIGGIRTHNLSRRAAADLRLRPRGHLDRLVGSSGVPRGGVGVFKRPRKFRRRSKIEPNTPKLWKLLKIAEFRTPTPQDVRKKGSKILKPPRFAVVLH